MEQVALGPAMLHYQASRLSGGERQRVAIARALAAEPDVMVCDEITSALDVSVQGAIVELLEGLRQERGISMLFVTHNLALVRSIAARVEILQAGRVVEAGSVVTVMETPQEDYTRKLLVQQPEDRLVGTDAWPHPPWGPGSRASRSSTPSEPGLAPRRRARLRSAAGSCRPRRATARGGDRRAPAGARARRVGRGDVDDVAARPRRRRGRARVVRRRAGRRTRCSSARR